MIKVFQGLYCDASESKVYNSAAISIGSANSAMLEGWLISSSLAEGPAKIVLQGSNDGQKWTNIVLPGPATVEIQLGMAAPDYAESSALVPVIGFSQLRATVILDPDPMETGKCVLDVAIRPFQAA